MNAISTLSSSDEFSSDIINPSEPSSTQQVAQKSFKASQASSFYIKSTLSRMILTMHPLDYISEGDGDLQDIFCDQSFDGRNFLELALQARYVAAVLLLNDLESIFIPKLPRYVFKRCEELMLCQRWDELQAFKEFILELSREKTLDPLDFIRYFLTRHRGVKDGTAYNFYRDLMWTLMRMHMLTRPLILAKLDFKNENPDTRLWYASVLGISSEELNPPSSCSIQ